MPIFDFICDICGQRNEFIVSFNSQEVSKPCTRAECGGNMIKDKNVPRSGFIFKTDGFYWTDERNGKK